MNVTNALKNHNATGLIKLIASAGLEFVSIHKPVDQNDYGNQNNDGINELIVFCQPAR